MQTFSNPQASRGPSHLVLIAATLILSACAGTPPTEQLALSTASVNRAGSAGATELAPAEMQMARDKLDKAKLAMTAEDYDKALSLAQSAQVDAQLAEAKARSTKAKKASDELQESVRVLREELDRKNKQAQ